jgi:hypothetical protein
MVRTWHRSSEASKRLDAIPGVAPRWPEAVARSGPDGHTLLLVPTWAAINATLYDKLGFNSVRDVAHGEVATRARAIVDDAWLAEPLREP